MPRHNLVVQLGSQVQFINGKYVLAPHTQMRTEASALVIQKGIAPRLLISGGSNFGVRYDDATILKPAVFTFEAFADADYRRRSEAAVIKDVLIKKHGIRSSAVFAETLSSTTEENAQFLKILLCRRPMFTGKESIAILTLLYHMEKALPVFRAAGLEVYPLFAENVLVDHGEPGRLEDIIRYYSTPKGGKQYPIDKMRELLAFGTPLTEMMQ